LGRRLSVEQEKKKQFSCDGRSVDVSKFPLRGFVKISSAYLDFSVTDRQREDERVGKMIKSEF